MKKSTFQEIKLHQKPVTSAIIGLALANHAGFGGWVCKKPRYILEDNLNKTELIEAIATGSEISKAAAGRALDAALQAIVSTVSKGDSVTLVGFGTFLSSKRAARTGKNPRTGEEIKIPAAVVPKFKAGSGFKEAVAKQTKKKAK